MLTTAIRNHRGKTALYAAFIFLFLLGTFKHTQGFIPPFLSTILINCIVVYQLYLPMWLTDKAGEDLEVIGLSRHWPHYLQDLLRLALIMLPTLSLFALAHHAYFAWFLHFPFHPRLPDGLTSLVLNQLLGVALPEELFYRGYLQTHLVALWPTHSQARRTLYAILLSNLIFACGHFIGEYDPSRLLTFFPGLIFAYLRLSSGRLYTAWLYHAACNLWSLAVWNAYHPHL